MADNASPLAADVPPPRTAPSRSTLIAVGLGNYIGTLLAAAIVMYVAGVLLIGLDLSVPQFIGATWLLAYASS